MAITMEPGRTGASSTAAAAPVAVPVARAYPIAEVVTSIDGKLDRLRVTPPTEVHALAYREATKLGEALCASPAGPPGRLDVAFGVPLLASPTSSSGSRRPRSDSVSSDDWGPYDGLGGGLGGSLRDVPSLSAASASFAGVGVGSFGVTGSGNSEGGSGGGGVSMLGGVEAMDLTLGPGDLDGLFHPEKACMPLLLPSVGSSELECAPIHASMAR